MMPTDEYLHDFYSQIYTESHQQEAIQKENADYYAGHSLELAQHVGKPIEALAIADVGCSFPVFLEQAVRGGCRSAVGVDWSAEARAYGERTGVRVLTPPEFLAQVPDASLDVLRYSHALEHMIDPLAVLTAHLRKLRPGGLLYVTQPNFPVFLAQATDIELMDCVWPNHLHFFSPLSVLRLFQGAGVEMKKFFTVVGEAEAQQRYCAIIDNDYASKALTEIAHLGEAARGPLSGFPVFSGENSAAYAFKLK